MTGVQTCALPISFGSSFCVDVKKKYIWRSASLLASPRGEVASRSDDGEGTVSVAIKYRSSQQQFSRALGHNANFAWNQDEASVKFDRQ